MGGLLLHGDTERSAALRHEIPIAIIVTLRRRAKSPAELDGIRAAQRAAEAGMAAAAELLARAQPADGRLELDGKPLQAEDVRAALRAACAEHGAPCPPDMIVASVRDG